MEEEQTADPAATEAADSAGGSSAGSADDGSAGGSDKDKLKRKANGDDGAIGTDAADKGGGSVDKSGSGSPLSKFEVARIHTFRIVKHTGTQADQFRARVIQQYDVLKDAGLRPVQTCDGLQWYVGPVEHIGTTNNISVFT